MTEKRRMSPVAAMALLTALSQIAGRVFCMRCGCEGPDLLTAVESGWELRGAGARLCPACAAVEPKSDGETSGTAAQEGGRDG